MNLFPDQQHALELAKEARIFILTGSAGTGKSTAVKAILQELAKPGFRIALAAPSGKAAKRLSEVTGYQASTIHRLLEPTRVEDRFVFTRGPRNPLEADLIVLDEVSCVFHPNPDTIPLANRTPFQRQSGQHSAAIRTLT